MRVVLVVIGMGLLAGCGADGEPTEPLPEPDVSANVSIGPDGVRVNSNAGISIGPVTINAGF